LFLQEQIKGIIIILHHRSGQGRTILFFVFARTNKRHHHHSHHSVSKLTRSRSNDGDDDHDDAFSCSCKKLRGTLQSRTEASAETGEHPCRQRRDQQYMRLGDGGGDLARQRGPGANLRRETLLRQAGHFQRGARMCSDFDCLQYTTVLGACLMSHRQAHAAKHGACCG
jgi:hypothetical protein